VSSHCRTLPGPYPSYLVVTDAGFRLSGQQDSELPARHGMRCAVPSGRQAEEDHVGALDRGRQIHRRGWRSETGTRPGDCYFLAKRFAIVIGIDPMIFHLEPSDNWLRILDIL